MRKWKTVTMESGGVSVQAKERPIIMSGPMVRALMREHEPKTVTRRVVKVPWKGSKKTYPYEPYYVEEDGRLLYADEYGDYHNIEPTCPYGKPGDRLYVREAFAFGRGYDTWPPRDVPDVCDDDGRMLVWYKADGGTNYDHGVDVVEAGRWRPAIHMPRWACRLVLEVTNVRVERLEDITPEECMREGIEEFSLAVVGHPGAWAVPGTRKKPNRGTSDPREAFVQLWEFVNGQGSWERDKHKWVWAVGFRLLPTGEASCG